jgi:hypothetical protein
MPVKLADAESSWQLEERTARPDAAPSGSCATQRTTVCDNQSVDASALTTASHRSRNRSSETDPARQDRTSSSSPWSHRNRRSTARGMTIAAGTRMPMPTSRARWAALPPTSSAAVASVRALICTFEIPPVIALTQAIGEVAAMSMRKATDRFLSLDRLSGFHQCHVTEPLLSRQWKIPQCGTSPAENCCTIC